MSLFHLEQERWMHDPWKVVVCCMLLNLTSIKQVGPMIDGFFAEFDEPFDVLDGRKSRKLRRFLKPLGLSSVRERNLKRFSLDWMNANTHHLASGRMSWAPRHEIDSGAIVVLRRVAGTCIEGPHVIVRPDDAWERAEGWTPLRREDLLRCTGVGKYAADCYSMLVLGDLKVKPDDKELKRRIRTLRKEARHGRV